MLVTNIFAMGTWHRTHQRLQDSAIELFTAKGFDAVTAAEVAAAAGVSEMTLFRHFATKEQLILGDPFDPMIAVAIRQRPAQESAWKACIRGLQDALEAVDVSVLARRLVLIANSGIPITALQNNNEATVDAIVEALIARGEQRLQAQVIAGAVIAGLSRGLLTWAMDQQPDIQQAFTQIFAALER